MLIKEVRVKWDSTRQREVAIAAGYRIRDGRVEVIQAKGRPDDDPYHVITAVRPASLAEQAMWDLLMKGESAWLSSN